MKLIRLFFVSVCLVFASTAMAEQCKAIHGQLGAFDFYSEGDPECKLDDVTFYYCIERPSFGTLAGRKYLYTSPIINGWTLEVPSTSLGGVQWLMEATYALSVFETPKGTLFMQEAGVFHWDTTGGWATHSSITGGTGHYEGATGWMAAAGSWMSMTLVGELCTP